MQEKQIPLFKAETTWFHIFRHMIESGDMATMGGACFMIYSTIKAYTDWNTGQSFPKMELIAEKTGLSERQVIRGLKKLEEMGYVKKEKQWRENVYTLREKVTIKNEEGRPAAEATWDYLPTSIKAAQAELKNFLMTGDKTKTSVIHIKQVIFNFNTQNIMEGGVGTQNNNSLDLSNMPQIKSRVEAGNRKRGNVGKGGAK